MSKETAGSGTATGGNSIAERKEKCRSARMHLHDAFRSNVRSCICNTDIPDSEKR